MTYNFAFFFFQAEDGIRDGTVTGDQTCALPIWPDLGSTGFFPGIARLLLAPWLRLPDRSATGFLHTQLQVGRSWHVALRVEPQQNYPQTEVGVELILRSGLIAADRKLGAFSMPWQPSATCPSGTSCPATAAGI